MFSILRGITLSFVLLLIGVPLSTQVGNCINPVSRIHDPIAKAIADTWKINVEEAEELVKLAFLHAPITGFPTPLDILAVIAVESSFQVSSIHPRGPSVGPMQINLAVHGKEAGESVSANVQAGSRILEQYRSKVSSDSQAFVAYNAGPAKGNKLCRSKACDTPYTKKIKQAKKRILNLYERS